MEEEEGVRKLEVLQVGSFELGSCMLNLVIQLTRSHPYSWLPPPSCPCLHPCP
jgi:hypothetical protein